jgi:predicted metal-dependent hydrolase
MDAEPILSFEESLRQGAELFNKREFFEAHEIWEDVWQEAEGDKRRLLQGLIQVAAGFHKLQIGMPSGTYKLLHRAVEHLALVPPEEHHTLELETLVASATYWRDEAKRMVDSFKTRYDTERIPTLTFKNDC